MVKNQDSNPTLRPSISPLFLLRFAGGSWSIFWSTLCVNHLGIPFLTFLWPLHPQISGSLPANLGSVWSLCTFLIHEAHGSVETGRLARGAAPRGGQGIGRKLAGVQGVG